MERRKCELRKLKRPFGREKKNEETRVINKQLKDDAGRVYANMREMLAKNENFDRSKYEGVSANTCEEDREKSGSIEKAASFWKELWEAWGTGNGQAVWLDEVRHAIFTKIPPPTDEDWKLETAEAGVLTKKKNWRAPGMDRLVNFGRGVHMRYTRVWLGQLKRSRELMMSIHPSSQKVKHY